MNAQGSRRKFSKRKLILPSQRIEPKKNTTRHGQRGARAAGKEAARAEADHQRKIERLRQDSQMRQTELIGARDALVLVRERRNYEINRQRAEEDNTVKLARKNEDFALEMAQMETHYQTQRTRRAEEFAKRQLVLEEELALVNQTRDEELALLADATKTQLDDLGTRKR